MTARHILITGVSSGIGEVAAANLLQQGNKVLGVGRTQGKLNQKDYPNFEFEQLDFSDLNCLKQQLPLLTKQYSGVDAIVLNAGFGSFGNLEEFSFKQISQLIDVNLTAQLYIARSFLPQLKSKQRGNLIFVGSESVLSGGRRGVVYVASKAGIAAVANALRKECSSSGIHVGIITPGITNSSFYDDAKFTHGDYPENYIECDDVAKAISFMLDSRAGTVVDEIRMSPLKSVIKRK